MGKAIHGFPKIFTIGQRYILDIFDGDVEVTEKIDGSQFNFGKVDGGIFMRSKNVMIYPGNEGMFKLAASHIKNIANMLPNNTIYHCEYLMKKKHNVLSYGRIPPYNLICFGVSHLDGTYRSDYKFLANALGLMSVPVLFNGRVENMEQLKTLLDKESVLGECKIEGVVVKNYNKSIMVGGRVYDIACGKFVSEEFKEVHQKDWKKNKTGKGQWETYMEGFRTEVRWNKAIQKRKEDGLLDESPRDIGELIKAIQVDITDEQKEDIKNVLWNLFKGQLLRKSIAGFPEYYKEWLAKRSFK